MFKMKHWLTAVLMLATCLLPRVTYGQAATTVRVVRFIPRGSDQDCPPNRYELWANSVTGKYRVCENGVLHDLLSGVPGASSGAGTAAIYTYYANQLDAEHGGTLILTGSTTPDYSFGTICSTCKGSAFLQAHDPDGSASLLSSDARSYVNTSSTGGAALGHFSPDDGAITAFGVDANIGFIPYVMFGQNGVVDGSYFGYYRTTFDPATGLVTFDKATRLLPRADPPYTCDADHEGAEYADTSHAKCFCDGSTWLKEIGAGTCS